MYFGCIILFRGIRPPNEHERYR